MKTEVVKNKGDINEIFLYFLTNIFPCISPQVVHLQFPFNRVRVLLFIIEYYYTHNYDLEVWAWVVMKPIEETHITT